ncbi:MAG: hypothetical protein KGI08_07685 [Thaumarchaeota archaeon]|nr:hypothetical protein [Nitrososphaerota archaeon]
MFAKSKTGPGIRKKQLDNQKPKLRFKGSGMVSNREYARGMEIIDSYPMRDSKLGKDEYFALMITDIENKGKRARSDYIDFEKGYIGLERNSSGEIYISKKFDKRVDSERGKTVMVKVSPEASILEL